MQTDEVQKILERFRDHVVSVSKRNLTNSKKNSSKKLYNSIKGNVKAMPNSFSMEFQMEDYGVFQDAGVSGTKKKYNTPYSYKSKMPPAKAFDKWLVRKGISPRDKSGKFTKRKSLAFLIARSVYRNGIKPSLFFTKPFESAYKNLPEELVEAYGLDAIKLFNQQIDEIINNGNN
jgi:hypothetical protein